MRDVTSPLCDASEEGGRMQTVRHRGLFIKFHIIHYKGRTLLSSAVREYSRFFFGTLAKKSKMFCHDIDTHTTYHIVFVYAY